MDLEKILKTANLLSKAYAIDLLRLLVGYKDISASEAASRLDLHIKTAQDFLEDLYFLQIVDKKEVFERTRPYFRYSLIQTQISLELNLNEILDLSAEKQKLNYKIRERKNSGIIFSQSANGERISGITLFTGKGREKKQQKIQLTSAQGKFLLHLPFPTGEFQKVTNIIEKAEIGLQFLNEILDLISILDSHNALEVQTK